MIYAKRPIKETYIWGRIRRRVNVFNTSVRATTGWNLKAPSTIICLLQKSPYLLGFSKVFKVSFANEPVPCRALLQKRAYNVSIEHTNRCHLVLALDPILALLD